MTLRTPVRGSLLALPLAALVLAGCGISTSDKPAVPDFNPLGPGPSATASGGGTTAGIPAVLVPTGWGDVPFLSPRRAFRPAICSVGVSACSTHSCGKSGRRSSTRGSSVARCR